MAPGFITPVEWIWYCKQSTVNVKYWEFRIESEEKFVNSSLWSLKISASISRFRNRGQIKERKQARRKLLNGTLQDLRNGTGRVSTGRVTHYNTPWRGPWSTLPRRQQSTVVGCLELPSYFPMHGFVIPMMYLSRAHRPGPGGTDLPSKGGCSNSADQRRLSPSEGSNNK